jgi:hypothetical protein
MIRNAIARKDKVCDGVKGLVEIKVVNGLCHWNRNNVQIGLNIESLLD